MDVSLETLLGQDISVLGPYRPWGYHKSQGGDHSTYPEHSGRVLDVKDNYPRGVSYFAEYIAPRVKSSQTVTVVPSHNPEKITGGLHALAGSLAEKCGLADGSGTLVRHTKISKLAEGGDRSITVHMNSVHVPDVALIVGQVVLLIDDVMTTGNSLLACRQLLIDAGAVDVKCIALGRTTY